MGTVTTIWEPVSVAVLLLIAAAAGLRWLIDRMDRQFERVHDRIDALADRLPGQESPTDLRMRPRRVGR